MEIEKIIEKLERGEYRIEHDSNCNCSVRNITEYGIDFDADECWQANTLIIDTEDGELELLRCTQYEQSEFLIDDLDWDNIPCQPTRDVQFSETDENPSHDVGSMVLDYLEGLPDGTRFYRDNCRGFANEFTSIIAEPDANENYIDEDWDEITADECASDIAYNGDAATQAYNSIKIID